MRRILYFPAALAVLLFLNGCANVLPKQALEAVTPGISYAEVKQNPDRYKGDTLLLGGMIIDNRITRQGSTLEILRYSLDRTGEPRKPDERSGRFLAETSRFLDPELYQAGRMITLTGAVVGQRSRPLGKTVYLYPVFRLQAFYLWPRYTQSPYTYGPSSPWGPPYWGPFWGPYWGGAWYYSPYWYGPYW